MAHPKHGHQFACSAGHWPRWRNCTLRRKATVSTPLCLGDVGWHQSSKDSKPHWIGRGLPSTLMGPMLVLCLFALLHLRKNVFIPRRLHLVLPTHTRRHLERSHIKSVTITHQPTVCVGSTMGSLGRVAFVFRINWPCCFYDTILAMMPCR